MVRSGRLTFLDGLLPPLGLEHQEVIVRKELAGCELVRAPHVSR